MSRRVDGAEQVYLRTAADQHGLINRRQLVACGLDKHAISRRVSSGLLIPVLPGVFLVNGAPRGLLQPAMAADLWAGKGSAISHTSAAAIHGWDGFSVSPIHVTTSGRPRPPAGLLIHNVSEPLQADITLTGPIRVTSVRRTLLDLAAMGHARLEKALDQARRQRPDTISELTLLLDKPEMLGRKGTRVLADLVHVRTPDGAPTQSELEDLFMRIVRRYRLPRPNSQWPIQLSGYMIHADFAYPRSRVAVECDSYTWHTDRVAFDRDRERDAELQALGWIVLRFTWSMLKWRDDYVARQVRHHLARRAEPALFSS